MKAKIYQHTCDFCKQTKVHRSTSTTGYAKTEDSRKKCFQCCGDMLAENMKKGFLTDTLYLSESGGRYLVTNWPGTLKIVVDEVRTSWHNMAGKDGRRDIWFRFGGHRWHGVNIGDNDLVRMVKVVKG